MLRFAMHREVIIALFMTMPPFHEDMDEPIVARTERLGHVSDGIHYAHSILTCTAPYGTFDGCETVWYGPEEKFVILEAVQAEFETHFSARLQRGICEEYECDRTRRRNPITRQIETYYKARGTWQVQRTTKIARKVWHYLPSDGSVPIRKITWAGAYAAGYSLALNACGGDVEKTFIAQSGKGCNAGPTKTSDARVKRYHELLATYRRLNLEHQRKNK